MKQLDTLPSQCRHIEHMHDEDWLIFYFFIFNQLIAIGELRRFSRYMACVYAKTGVL